MIEQFSDHWLVAVQDSEIVCLFFPRAAILRFSLCLFNSFAVPGLVMSAPLFLLKGYFIKIALYIILESFGHCAVFAEYI